MRNALSIDVEDYFQVSAFAGSIDRASWSQCEPRVQKNTERILSILAERNVKATFFTLGWVAERCKPVVRSIVDEGHELASHGYGHELVTELSDDQFREDVKKAKQILEDVGGTEIIGYRAPTYSIGAKNSHVLEILQHEGYRYSSSIYPVKHDLYGFPSAPRFAYAPFEGFTEIPITTLRVLGRNMPCGGGGFFRLYPYFLSKWALRRVNAREARPCVFYFHPWEVDPEQPAVPNLPWKSRFRHYLNLEKTEFRLKHLLRDFDWGRMDRVFRLREAAENA